MFTLLTTLASLSCLIGLPKEAGAKARTRRASYQDLKQELSCASHRNRMQCRRGCPHPDSTSLPNGLDFVSEADIRVVFHVPWLFLFEDNFVLSYSLVKVVFKLNVKEVSVEMIDIVVVHWVPWVSSLIYLYLRMQKSTLENTEKPFPKGKNVCTHRFHKGKNSFCFSDPQSNASQFLLETLFIIFKISNLLQTVNL